MKLSASFLALLLLFCAVVSCRLAESLTGDPKAGTVSSLWPDVPALDGAKKADLEIPLGARLVIRAVMQGKINFIAFTTDKSARDVKDYYSIDRMKAAGWKPSDKGCIGDTEDTKNHGLVCLYSRNDNAKDEGLAIIVAEDQKTKETNIFYARIDATEAKPSSSR